MMYIFSRTRTVNPEHMQEAMTYSVEVAKHVTNVSGFEVYPWTSVYGMPIGTNSWSARVDSHAAMGVAQEKLLKDKGYQKLIADASRLFVGPAEDVMMEFVSASGDGKVQQFASLVSAQCAPGRISDAMGWGVDIMNHVAKVTGRNAAMVRGLYGPWATIGWITSADSLEDVDSANAAIAADAKYIQRIDEGGPLFVASSARQWLIRRLS
jgi:hypothetical protein